MRRNNIAGRERKGRVRPGYWSGRQRYVSERLQPVKFKSTSCLGHGLILVAIIPE